MATKTEQVLADMLTENTGRHFLDSGGAYGRAWERQQGKTVDDFIAAPKARIDRHSGIVLDVFHYLNDRLEYAEDMDDAFSEYLERKTDPNLPWLACAEEFVEFLTGMEVGGQRDYRHDAPIVVNTYNSEEFLSQTIQYVEFVVGDDRYVMLQIHGGCDVRGGYTRPRPFRVTLYESSMFGYDVADAQVSCKGKDDPDFIIGQMALDGRVATHKPAAYHVWDVRGSLVEWHATHQCDEFGDWTVLDNEGPGLNIWDAETDDDGHPLCECGALLVVDPPYTD